MEPYPSPTLKERCVGLLRPAELMLLGMSQYPITVLDTIYKDPISIFNWTDIQLKAFSRLWLKYGQLLSATMPPKVEALLQSLHGTVLDLGPGTGTQLPRFNFDSVDVIYGAEPAVDMHAELAASAKRAGFGERYHILSCGAEQESLIPALAKQGLFANGVEHGVFDEILCLRVLCGVPRPQETIAGLYRLLKPGGRLIIAEHVKNSWDYGRGSFLGSLFQRFYSMCGWQIWLGGCDLRRDTGTWLRQVGGNDGWSKVDLDFINGWSPIPHVIGSMTKAHNPSESWDVT